MHAEAWEAGRYFCQLRKPSSRCYGFIVPTNCWTWLVLELVLLVQMVHTHGTKGERGWIGGKRWLTRPRCWEAVVRVTLANGRRGNCQKVLRKELRIELHALQGCNMSTWRWTWGRNLSVNEGWQDNPPVSFSSDFCSTKRLSPMINAKSACMIPEGSNGSTSTCI